MVNHKYIITVDSSVINISKLPSLISKGPKNCEPAKIDFGMAREKINTELDEFIETLADTRL